MKTSKKILIVTGDAGESFEILFASHRLREAGWKSEHNCIEVMTEMKQYQTMSNPDLADLLEYLQGLKKK